MADITRNTKRVAIVHPEKMEAYPAIAAVTLEPGRPVILNTAGKFALGDASAAGTAKARGLCLASVNVPANGAFTLLKRGQLEGWDVSGLAYGALVYLSDTEGEFADAAGTVSLVCGIVVPKTDKDLTKVIHFEFNWLT